MSLPIRIRPHGRWLGLGLSLGVSLLVLEPPLRAEVRGAGGTKSLGTLVNGSRDGACGAGLCEVSGGTAAGRNLFHRFAAFDTRGAITGVRIQSEGYRNVMVGVLSPLGTFIDKGVALSSKGNLFWLSPGGLAISGGGGFQNVQHLQLSTATGLRFGAGLFDALNSTAEQAALLVDEPQRGSAGLLTDPTGLTALGLQANGDLTLADGALTVEESLLLDSQGGNVLLQAAQVLLPGGVVELSGRSISATGSTVDVSSGTGAGGRALFSGETVSLNQSTVNASGALGGGSISISAVAGLTLDQSDLLARGGQGSLALTLPQPQAAVVDPAPADPQAQSQPAPVTAADQPVVTPAAADPTSAAAADPAAAGPPAAAVDPLAPTATDPASAAQTPSVSDPQPAPSASAGAPASVAAEPQANGGTIALVGQQIQLVGGVIDASGESSLGHVQQQGGIAGLWTYRPSTSPVSSPVAAPVVPAAPAAPVTAATVDAGSTVATGQGGSITISGADVRQAGTINANGSSGGRISVTAQNAIEAAGSLLAQGLQSNGGAIQLQSGQQTSLLPGALLDVSGASAGGSVAVNGGGSLTISSAEVRALGLSDQGVGGTVELTAGNVQLNAAHVDASGIAGGGEVLVGGGERGAVLPSRAPLAQRVQVDARSVLQADARVNGDGGRVITYAADTLSMDGTLFARGGSQGGDGGFVETSANSLLLGRSKTISTTAPKGASGSWLIDPTDFTVGSFGGLATVNEIDVGVLESSLLSGNVIISTQVSCASTCGKGDIYVNAPVSWGGNRLTLSAYRNIFVNANLVATGNGALSFYYGQGTADGAGASYAVAPEALIEVPLGPNAFTWRRGTDSTKTLWGNASFSAGTDYPVVLDNGLIRAWQGSSAVPVEASKRYSFNGAGALQQPSVLFGSTWGKLTYDQQPLEFAIGVGNGALGWGGHSLIVGSGSSGSVDPAAFSSLGIAAAASRLDVSQYFEGSGTVKTNVAINVSLPVLDSAPQPIVLGLINAYTLADNLPTITISASIENRSQVSVPNVRYWLGTSDDYLDGGPCTGSCDAPGKQRGAYSDGGAPFALLSGQQPENNAIQLLQEEPLANGSTGPATARKVVFYAKPSGQLLSSAFDDWGYLNTDNTYPLDTYVNAYNRSPADESLGLSVSAVSAQPDGLDGSYAINAGYGEIGSGVTRSTSFTIHNNTVAEVASPFIWNWSEAFNNESTSWSNPGNWSLDGVPAEISPSSDAVVIIPYYQSTGNAPWSVDFDLVAESPLTIRSLTSYADLSVAPGASLVIGNAPSDISRISGGAGLNVSGGTVAIGGSLSTSGLVLTSGIFGGTGDLAVAGTFDQRRLFIGESAYDNESMVNMSGGAFRSLSLYSPDPVVIRDLRAEGDISVSGLGQIDVFGIIESTNGSISLSALGGQGRIALGGQSQLSAKGLASGKAVRARSSTELALQAGGVIDVSNVYGSGGTIQLDAPVIRLAGAWTSGYLASGYLSGSLPPITLNASGFSQGGVISIGSLAEPASVSFENVYLSADPPAQGGSIAVSGSSITATGSVFDVSATSGGSVTIGSSASQSISITGGGILGSSSAAVVLTSLATTTSGVAVSGPVITYVNPSANTGVSQSSSSGQAAPSQTVSSSPSAPVDPSGGTTTTAPPADTSSSTTPSTDNQTPATTADTTPATTEQVIQVLAQNTEPQVVNQALSTQEADPVATTATTTVTADPSVPQQPAVQASLETSSSFELVGDLAPVVEGLAQVLLDGADVAVLSAFIDSDIAPGDPAVASLFKELVFELADGLTSDVGDGLDGSSALQSDSSTGLAPADPVSAMLGSAKEADAEQAVASSSGSAAESTSAGSAGGSSVSVTQRSSEETAQSFSSGEQKSSQETAAKLGLGASAGQVTVPTPQQLQGALLKIQQFVRAQQTSTKP